MRRLVFTLIAFLPVLALLACASVTEAQCKAGNWAGIGLADGNAGRSASVLSAYTEDCAKIGVTPDKAEWQRGWEQGILTYCTVENAYYQGRNGYGLSSVCPSGITPRLQRANLWGQSYNDIWDDLDDLQDEARELRRLINSFPPNPTDEEKALRQRYRNRLANIELDMMELRLNLRRYDRLPPGLIAL